MEVYCKKKQPNGLYNLEKKIGPTLDTEFVPLKYTPRTGYLSDTDKLPQPVSGAASFSWQDLRNRVRPDEDSPERKKLEALFKPR